MTPLMRKRSGFGSLSRLLGLAPLVLLALSACNRQGNILEVGAAQLYADGAEAMRANNFPSAVASFQQLGLRYPFAPEVRQAQLDLIYALYKTNQPESALDVAQQFVRENPRLPEVAYCLYMIGLIQFDKDPNVLERLFRVDITERPPKETYEAFSAFQDLIRQFPDSPYVNDARQRMVYLRNRLAQYENHVADYYLRRGAYIAAATRAQYAVEHYPGAPELERSLAIMAEAYETLGMADLAADARRVLRENFPSAELASADD